jgi:hypothetical protein
MWIIVAIVIVGFISAYFVGSDWIDHQEEKDA